MTLPIDRSKLALAQSNQTPGQVAASVRNKDALTEAYNTIDELNQKVEAHAGSAVLPHADKSVTRAKLADKVVGAGQLDDAVVGPSHHQDNGIPSRALPDNVILQRHMSDNSVGSAEIQAGAVQRTHIQNGAVGAGQLDPALLQNYGDIAVQSKFAEVDAHLADIALNVKSFGAKGDANYYNTANYKWYVDATFRIEATDDTVAIQNAIDYAYSRNMSKVYLPAGTYVTTKPLYVWGTNRGRQLGIHLYGDSNAASRIKKVTHGTLNDGSEHATIDAILILANQDKVTTNDTSGQIISDLVLGGTIDYNGTTATDYVQYGIYAKTNVSFTRIENLLIDTTKIGIRFEQNYWQNQIINAVVYAKEKGISMNSTGTSNYLEKCFVVGTTVKAYELKGIYSSASSLTAQWCTGVVFDFSWGDWSVSGIGEEDSLNSDAIVKTQEANVTLSGVTFYANRAATSKVVKVDANSTLTINGGTIGLNATSLGRLYETTSNSKLILNNVNITDKYTLLSAGGNLTSVTKMNNAHSTGINLLKANRRPYIGINRRQKKFINDFDVTPTIQGKAIFLSVKDHPYYDTDGTDFQFDNQGYTGDLYLVDDPKKKGVLGWVTTSDNAAANGALNNCTFAIIPITIVGTNTQRPTQPVPGAQYFDTTLGKPIWCKTVAVVDGSGNVTTPAVWVDATGTTV